MGLHDGIGNGKSFKAIIAGVLMVIAFLLVVITVAQILTMDMTSIDLEESVEDEDVDEGMIEKVTEIINTIKNMCGVVLLAMGLLLLMGGICAITQRYWAFSLVAAMIGIFSFGPFCMSSALSLIALILILFSEREFGKKERHIQPHQPNGFREYTCSYCGNSRMRYDNQHRLWYCENCKRYR